ncbi:right-handed parallel beta-helix repeat-containing protein [Fulvivirgaceae bacterium BMA10]|uniref:Right-handed parallel beta-helix repeat-containing protein n=1 Tax=Splendidivirga corallicola TaxID=3051826 RepID=A0ABT8KMX0_9BACT|nr:right-handed parallel beta-helix repeat-containing protein [Fulvivirgaceae bacterium BMA10]
MKKQHLLFLLGLIILAFSCKPEEEIFSFDTNLKLEFSKDTILFDTVFTSIGSVTKRLIVKNPNRNALRISDINLAGRNNSPYSIIVNGFEGENFKEEKLLGGDSLLILVKVLIDPNSDDLPFFVKDSIVFNTNGNIQDVKLIAYGQNANFLNDSILACNTVWDSERPYVISNSILVDTLCSLTIEKGTKVFSENGSFIFIKGSLVVNGEAQDQVLFRNSRLDEDFEEAPGQWGGIIFLPGSKNNKINFAEIKNAQVGLNLDTFDSDTIPELVIENTIIKNMSTSGILTIGADLIARNTLVHDCAEFTIGNFGGGNYTYHNCTFASFRFKFFRQDPSIVVTDIFQRRDESVLTDNLRFEMVNCIGWGDLENELAFDNSGNAQFELIFANNLLRTQIQELDINENILNADPKFIDAASDFHLDTLSPAKDKGIPLLNILKDLDNNDRDDTPDIGAYERIE